MGRVLWVHCKEREDEEGKGDVLAKLCVRGHIYLFCRLHSIPVTTDLMSPATVRR